MSTMSATHTFQGNPVKFVSKAGAWTTLINLTTNAVEKLRIKPELLIPVEKVELPLPKTIEPKAEEAKAEPKATKSIVKPDYKKRMTVVKLDDGRRVMDSGDATALFLRGITLDQLYTATGEMLSDAEYDKKRGFLNMGMKDVPAMVEELKQRYAKLNVGQQSMNLRNIYRSLSFKKAEQIVDEAAKS
jgi:hypothetical protein